MNRFSVLVHPLVVLLLGLLCVCLITMIEGACVENGTPEMKITDGGKAAPPPPARSKARLEALEPNYNFGCIHSDNIKTISHTFVLRNTGEETLIISKVRPSCGCTSAVASANQIAPGATATVTATLNPKGKYGNQTITVRINSNDPDNASQVLRMSGTILSAWRILPLQLDMGGMGKVQSITKEIKVTSQYLKEEPQFRITAIKTESPNIRAATIETPAPKTGPPNPSIVEVQRTVRVSLTSGSTEGDQSQHIYIATDDPKNPTHTVTVRWSVEKDLACQPKRFMVSELRGRKNSRDITLSSHSGAAFDVTSIEIQGDKGNEDIEVTLKADPTPSRKVYTISPKIVTDAPQETRNGKIIFKTTHPEQPELVVPYTASYRK